MRATPVRRAGRPSADPRRADRPVRTHPGGTDGRRSRRSPPARSTCRTTAASFGNKMMWWPIVVVPTAIPAGIAAVFSRRAAKTVLPLASARDRRQRTARHLSALARHRADARRLSTRYNLESGPPAVRAAAGLARRRDGAARRRAAPRGRRRRRRLMPFRSPSQRAVTPQRTGPLPGLRRAGQVDGWDDVTAGVVLPAWPCRRARVLHPGRGGGRRAAAGSAARPGRRTASAGPAR